MPNDRLPVSADSRCLSTASTGSFTVEGDESAFAGIGWWLAGGAALVGWTALSLLLVTA